MLSLNLRPQSAQGFIAFGFAAHMIVMSLAFIFIFHRGLGPIAKLRAFLTGLHNDPDQGEEIDFRRTDFVKEIQPELQQLRETLQNKKRGESLLTVLIAGVIGTLLLMALITGVTNSQKGSRAVSDDVDLAQAVTTARYVLTSEVSCARSVKEDTEINSLNVKANLGALRNKSMILYSSPSDASPTKKSELAPGDTVNGITIQSIQFEDQDASDLGNGSILTSLVITGKKAKGVSFGGQIIQAKLPMNII